MVAWKYTFRRIDGHRRRVKVKTTTTGRSLVRVIGRRNCSDATAPRRNARRRVAGHYNYSDRRGIDHSR